MKRITGYFALQVLMACLAVAGISGVAAGAVNKQSPPPGMVWIPEGEFLTGSEESWRERPVRKVYLKGYFIDIHEVTNREYKEFNRNHWYPPSSADKPVANISWKEAAAYAKWAGKRLPTALEWEKAARGTDGRLYPWGNERHPEWINCSARGIGGVLPVGSDKKAKSPFGLVDTAGNVWEWVADPCDSTDASGKNDKGEKSRESGVGGTEGAHLIKGGSWDVSYSICRLSNSMCMPGESERPDVGFRCVKELSPMKTRLKRLGRADGK